MDRRITLTNVTILSKITEEAHSELPWQNSAASANSVRNASINTLTLCSTEFDEEEEEEDETKNGVESGAFEPRKRAAAEKWEERGEATLFKRTHQVKKLRQFMPSIIEETEEMCKQEEEDEENEAASKLALVVDEHDALFDAEFLNFIIEGNVVAEDPSKADPDFIQDFSEVLRILRKKAKLEEAFAKNIATHLTAMRIKEKAILLKYIRHILLHDMATIDEFFKSEGFASIISGVLPTDEMLDQVPGIILAIRRHEAALRQLVDEGVINILVKLSKRNEDAIVAGAAVAHACLIEVQGVDRQALDAWFDCLLDLGSCKNATAQTYACAALCKTTAHVSQQASYLQKAGTAPFFKLFISQNTPEALLWVSGALSNLASKSANFQDFLELEALDVLHSMANSTWDEVRLEAAWILVFLSLHKALHQQAVGHWGAWVRDALTIGLCSNDTLTTVATRFFFANVTEQEAFKGYESPVVQKYLKALHLSDDTVREQAQALLLSTARERPTDLIEALLALCCTDDEAEENIALKALSSLAVHQELQASVAKYNLLRPFVCGARSTDGSTQLLCAQILTSFVSTSQALQDNQDLEPVSALLFLCDSKHDEVRMAALNGLWVALEVGLRHPQQCAIPILRCCKEDETAETLRGCHGRVITEARKEFVREWCGRVSDAKLFGAYSLCTLVHDSSAAVQGRLAYEIEKFSEDREKLASLGEIGAQLLVYALMSLGKSVVDAVKCSVVTVFTRLMSCSRRLRERSAVGSNPVERSSAFTTAYRPSDESLQCFLAESYKQCVCDILLDLSVGAELRLHCLSTVRASLDDPAVCHCLGTTDFMSRLFSVETTRTGNDKVSFYMVYCKLLTHPATVGHVLNHLNTLQGLLRDAKDFPSLVLPLAHLLHASSFLPQVQGMIYSNLKEVCKLVTDSASAGASSEAAVLHFLGALANLSRVPGSKFQQFETVNCSLPRPVLLDLLALLKRYSVPPLSLHANESKNLPVCDRQVPQNVKNTLGNSTVARDAQLQAESLPTSKSIVTVNRPSDRKTESADMLKSIVEALLALYRLGVMKGQMEDEVTQRHLLPVFQNMRHSNSSMIPLLSFANNLCEDPVFLDSLLSTSIVSDIASGLAEDSLQDEELCLQVAEFLRVALLHEGAQEKVLADIALVDCIFRLIRSAHPAAQARALFALHSIITHASILRMIAAENFVETLCNIALRGGTADVQRVAAGVISTLIARTSCREVLFTATSFMEIMHLVRVASRPEVFLQVVWALSYLPLRDDVVQVLIDKHVPERFKELLVDEPPPVQLQAVNTVGKLSTNEKLRHRFIKLEFLPLLAKMAKNTDAEYCIECIKALRLLCDSAAESATVLDFGVELTIHAILKKCLQQSQDISTGLRHLPQPTLEPENGGTDSDMPCDIADIACGRTTDLDKARKASLALLCQLCKHAVHDQLALLGDETVKTVVRCVANFRPQGLRERRSVSTLFRLWAGVGRLRQLMIHEGGFDVVMQLVTQADDPAEMVELASCIGSFASEKSAAMETRLAESGAVDALQVYAVSRHTSVRESAQHALSSITRVTMEYSQLLATRESHTLGLSAAYQENRALLKTRRMNAGAMRVSERGTIDE